MSKRPYESGDATYEAPPHGAGAPVDFKKARVNYDNANRVLFCRNLEYSATEEDLRNIKFFSNAISIKISLDRETGQPRGFCHIEYETEEDADKALDDIEKETGDKGIEVNGRYMVCDFGNTSGKARFGGTLGARGPDGMYARGAPRGRGGFSDRGRGRGGFSDRGRGYPPRGPPRGGYGAPRGGYGDRGGYGGPPRGPPRGRGGYGGPPDRGGYGGDRGYGGPPRGPPRGSPRGGYGGGDRGGYSDRGRGYPPRGPPRGGYGGPPDRGGYGGPPRGGYSDRGRGYPPRGPPRGGYGGPPSDRGGYGGPPRGGPPRGGYGGPPRGGPPRGGYGSPRGGYGGPPRY